MSLSDDSLFSDTHPAVSITVARKFDDRWNDTNIFRLRELIAQKLTTSQIAASLSKQSGETFTRNAIIGKARRLGIPLLGEKVRPIKKTQAKPKPKPVTIVKVKAPPLTAPTPPTLTEVVANPKNFTILEVQRGECYWPVSGDGAEMLFCGHSTGSSEKSWCPAHSRLGYTPSHVRQWSTAR